MVYYNQTRILWLIGLLAWMAPCCILPAFTQGIANIVLSRIDAASYPVITGYVSVTDEKGNSLPGLVDSNFTVTEDDQLVSDLRVTSELPGDEQVAIALVIDSSGSMRGAPLSAAKQAAADFVSRLSEKDLLSVIAFGSRVKPLALLTNDHTDAANSINRLQSGGETALYDALRAGISIIAETAATRKAVVVLTDGNDNASKATARQCITAAKRDGVTIYSIGLGKAVNRGMLRSIADESGGSCFLTDRSDDLLAIYRKIARQIHNQYRLSYHSLTDGSIRSWHTVKVTVHQAPGEGTSQRQYLIHTSPVESIPTPGIPFYGAIFGLLILDLALVVVLVTRRLKGSSRKER